MRREYLRRIAGTLVVEPNPRQFGHLGLELLWALAAARRDRSRLWVLPARHSANQAVYLLRSTDVDVAVAGPARAAMFRALIGAVELPARTAAARRRAARVVREELERELARHAGEPDLPAPIRQQLKRWKSRVGRFSSDEDEDGEPVDLGPYLQRRLMREPVAVGFDNGVRLRAERAARTAGIPADRPIVTVHAREAGYKRGMEVHEKQQRAHGTLAGVRNDETRNASITSYIAAIDFLLGSGYTVVRIGDPSMQPLGHPGVIDLTRCTADRDLLQIWVLLQSRFLVCGESGLLGISYLTNTPMLTVNATDPISSYPIRRDGMYILKHVVDRGSGHTLTLRDMLRDDYLASLRDTTRFEYADNTPEEILEAVREMRAMIEDAVPETPPQAEFRDDVTRVAGALADRLPYVRKWGLDGGFLGDGRLSPTFAEQLRG